jgi:hypothetical protein
MHQCTFHGLHEWHDSMFEKLGWMIMAKEHNNKLKIEAYLDGIKGLQKSLENKWHDTRDIDRKDDLSILINNMKCLECDANKLMKISFVDHKHKMNKSGDSYKVTQCGLQHWMKCKFENLGWMCLAQSDKNTLRINAYFESIDSLIASIEEKIKEVQEKDRKDDLEITLENTHLLKHYAMHLLKDKDDTRMSKKSQSRKSIREPSHKSIRKTLRKTIRKSSRKSSSKSLSKPSSNSKKTKKTKKSKKSRFWFS